MNMGLLYLTALGMGYERRGSRLFLGAAAGAAWTVLFAALPPAPLWLSLLVSYGAAGPSMCLAAYGFRGFRELFKSAVFLALATAFAGGALGQLYRHTGLGYAAGALNGGSLLLFLFLALGVFYGGRALFLFGAAVRRERRELVTVILYRNGRSLETRALIDTGNRLREPVTGLPVSIGEAKALKALFPEDWEETGFVFIPYDSIGGKGLLKGRLIDRIELREESGRRRSLAQGPTWMALREERLSDDGSYQVILNGSILTGNGTGTIRRGKNGHQSVSSKQVSAQNHFRHEEPSVFKEKRGSLYRRQRRAPGASRSREGGRNDRHAGNGGGEGGEGGAH